MPDIELVILHDYVRIERGVNGEKVSALDPVRHKGLTFEENSVGDVIIFRNGVRFSRIPSGDIKQVIYAEPKPSVAKAKV